MASHGARVSLAGLAKHYGSVVALAPTDLEIEPGEFFSLIGPSGSGKSTLLGAVAGFLPPTAGRIEIDGEDVVAIPPYRRNLGMVFQNYALFPHMSVFENIAFPLRLRNVSNGEIKLRVEHMLDTVRLGYAGDRSPAQLSGGQQQRVALARAAVYGPRLLLMDEPLGALDKNLREEMQYEIRQFHAALGVTILYVTHDQDEAATMSSRIGIMKDGRIAQIGRPRDLYEKPRNAFIAGFLGEANLFEVKNVQPNGSGSVMATTSEGLILASSSIAAAAGAVLVACVRPEAIQIHHAPAGGNSCGATQVAGHIQDIVFNAGTVRYRVTTDAGARFTVKLHAQRHGPAFEIGQAVFLTWRTADTLLIPKE
jgi:putative spermidine/putrescine transport system ATP-binding protein